jgi:predicted RNA-binding Zn-ribbon protein involved in translation (DUF1610 family)
MALSVEVESLKAKLAAASARPYFACPECGPTAVDEDGCCRTCGADAEEGQ